MIIRLNSESSEINIEIFAIGNELCYGKIYDTNSFWLAEQITNLGAKVKRITCIPDDLDMICNSLREALSRNPDFIISTGGLGPTHDDLTIEALSQVFLRPITVQKRVVKKMAKRRNVPVDQLSPYLLRMLRTLKGAECLANPLGWAAITIVNNGKTTIVSLPGPPTEVKACFTQYLAKRIRSLTGHQSDSRRIFVPMYESQVSPITDYIMETIPSVYLKPLVSEYQKEKGLPIEIIAFAETREICQKKLDQIVEKLEELIPKKNNN